MFEIINGGKHKHEHEDKEHVHNSLCLNLDTLFELKDTFENHMEELVHTVPEDDAIGTDWYDEKFDIVIILDGEAFALGLDPDMYKGFMKFIKEQLVERI